MLRERLHFKQGEQGEHQWKDFIRKNNVVDMRKPAVDIWEESTSGRGKNMCKNLAVGAILDCLRKSRRASMAA